MYLNKIKKLIKSDTSVFATNQRFIAAEIAKEFAINTKLLF